MSIDFSDIRAEVCTEYGLDRLPHIPGLRFDSFYDDVVGDAGPEPQQPDVPARPPVNTPEPDAAPPIVEAPLPDEPASFETDTDPAPAGETLYPEWTG